MTTSCKISYNQDIHISTVKVKNISIPARIPCVAFLHPHPFTFFPHALGNLQYVLHMYNFSFKECHISGFIQHLTFADWLFFIQYNSLEVHLGCRVYQ